MRISLRKSQLGTQKANQMICSSHTEFPAVCSLGPCISPTGAVSRCTFWEQQWDSPAVDSIHAFPSKNGCDLNLQLHLSQPLNEWHRCWWCLKANISLDLPCLCPHTLEHWRRSSSEKKLFQRLSLKQTPKGFNYFPGSDAWQFPVQLWLLTYEFQLRFLACSQSEEVYGLIIGPATCFTWCRLSGFAANFMLAGPILVTVGMEGGLYNAACSHVMNSDCSAQYSAK